MLPDGTTLVLIEHPLLEPLPQSAAAGGVSPAQTTAKFVVACELLWSLAACTTANRTLLASELELAYADFVGTHKFREPRLWRTTGTFDGTALEPILTPVAYYFGIYIDTSPCALNFGFGDPIGGVYNSNTSTLTVCMTPTSTSADSREHVRHEFFHAIQFAYDQLNRDDMDASTRAGDVDDRGHRRRRLALVVGHAAQQGVPGTPGHRQLDRPL